jgi:hypothetical protein
VGDLPLGLLEGDVEDWLRRALSPSDMREAVSDIVVRRSTNGTATYAIITVVDLCVAELVREEPHPGGEAVG